MYYLGVDIGTTNIKAALFGEDGEQIAEDTMPNRAVRPLNWDAMDANALADSIKSLIRKVCQDQGSEVAALGFSSMGETVLPVGSDVEQGALAPGIYWYETCTMPQFDRLRTRIDPREIHRLTALNPSWIYSASKVMKLRDERPDIYEKTRAFLDVSSFMAWLMTGEAGFDLSLASRTLLLDVQNARWSPELFVAAGLDMDKFPPLKAPGEVRGRLRPTVARELGLNPAAIVVTSGQDHIAAAYGADVQREDEAMVSIGTSAAFYIPADRACYLTDAFLKRFYLAGGYSAFPGDSYILTGLSAGGFCVDWFVNRVLGRGYLMLSGMNLGRTRTLFLPNLRAQMDAFPSGGFTDLTDEDTGESLLQAIMEALAFECRVTLEEAFRARLGGKAGEESGGKAPEKPGRVVVLGGAAVNSLLAELIASVLGSPLEVPPFPRLATARGAALSAARACGRGWPLQRHAGTTVPPSPVPGLSDYLEEKYQRHLKLFRGIENERSNPPEKTGATGKEKNT